MSRNHRLAKAEQAAAARRVLAEGEVSVHELAKRIGVTGQSLQRWIVEGRAGVHLDGFHRPGTGWMTSEEAVKRFLAATAEKV
jgi:transposase-like protein